MAKGRVIKTYRSKTVFFPENNILKLKKNKSVILGHPKLA